MGSANVAAPLFDGEDFDTARNSGKTAIPGPPAEAASGKAGRTELDAD
ncbi:MAG TPA: hypothetical protein VK943_02585 [Arenibaculum sp.]|nr:hypothetical protein [Arenibaculum sp.]